uniref:Peptidase A2 domain-containing protein n=1 Tax=Strongyloides stercoralis TaxID=6248 RepID=A0AAF5RSV9_STRER
MQINKDAFLKNRPVAVVRVNYNVCSVYIDDGSDISLISEERWTRFGKPEPTEANTKMNNTHEEFKSLGIVKLPVELNYWVKVNESFFITKGLKVPVLLGRTFLRKFGVFRHNYQRGELQLGDYMLSEWINPEEKEKTTTSIFRYKLRNLY